MLPLAYVVVAIAAVAIIAALGLVYAVYRCLENRVKGTLAHIHTLDTLYNKSRYGHILDYDAHSLILHGQRTLILSGEFHYWRLPDRSRWRPILEQYRSAGLNCIRIYFHWGFHSPSEGTYVFEDNRDIDYLLKICEEVGLYVLAAPGPYICAETQAGGFPIWLAAKRDIRLRHMKTNLWKEYDPKFMAYCVDYFEHILPIIARHQITNRADTSETSTDEHTTEGCVISLQIENESFQHIFGYPIGLHDDMKMLAKTARDCGITVPLFTNDGFEEGSFIVKDDPRRKKKDFGVDLYGFDKYVVFTPDSEPKSWAVGRDSVILGEWDPSTVVSSLDKMEKNVRAFGHANKRTPIFIPELQGGWFNHYGIQYTYDAIYRFYGDQYTRLMLDTVVSQGCTMLNFYMFYGGTNWGTIGDPDVYTSYDYSACIRENGLMSGRLRKLRLGLLFLQSFSDVLVSTEAVTSGRKFSVQSSLKKTICQQRLSRVTGPKGPVELTFVRNFSTEKLSQFDLRVLSKERNRAVAAKLACSLPYKASFIALGNYTTAVNPEIHLLLSATPIHIRAFSPIEDGAESEIWIAALASSGSTEMAFNRGVVLKEFEEGVHLREPAEDQNVTVLSVPEGFESAYVVLSSSTKDDPSSPLLHIVFLDQKTLLTLYCHYDNRHSAYAAQAKDGPVNIKNMASSPKIVTWGAYNSRYDPQHKTLTAESTDSERRFQVLTFGAEAAQDTLIPGAIRGSPMSRSGLNHQSVALKQSQTAVMTQEAASLWAHKNHHGIALGGWETRTTDFNTYAWQPCPRKSPSSDLFQKVSMDFHFTSGHIIYRGTFQTRETHRSHADEETGLLSGRRGNRSPISLKINVRNRATVYVNGVCIGSYMTYSRQLLAAGAKMGYDTVSFGSHTFQVTQEALAAAGRHQDEVVGSEGPQGPQGHQAHEIIIVIESFGLSRQPFIVNDIRNPRGLLSARVHGKDVIKGSDEAWLVAGVDVTQLDMVYGSTGFPDEHSQEGWTQVGEADQGPRVQPNRGVAWWRTQFQGPPSDSASTLSEGPSGSTFSVNIPLCCRLEGEFSAMIILNNVLVGRYFGSGSPQHEFYLMDGLVNKAESGRENELKLVMYGDQETVDEVNKVRVQILPWVIEDAQGELGLWSGNAAFSAQDPLATEIGAGPFWTMKQSFSM